jgi:hypothetical protein
VDDSHKIQLVQSQLMGKFMVQKRIQVQIWPPHDLQHADLPTEAKKTKLIIIIRSLQKTIQRRRSTQRHKVIEPLLYYLQ